MYQIYMFFRKIYDYLLGYIWKAKNDDDEIINLKAKSCHLKGIDDILIASLNSRAAFFAIYSRLALLCNFLLQGFQGPLARFQIIQQLLSHFQAHFWPFGMWCTEMHFSARLSLLQIGESAADGFVLGIHKLGRKIVDVVDEGGVLPQDTFHKVSSGDDFAVGSSKAGAVLMPLGESHSTLQPLANDLLQQALDFFPFFLIFPQLFVTTLITDLKQRILYKIGE